MQTKTVCLFRVKYAGDGYGYTVSLQDGTVEFTSDLARLGYR
ncbi:MAG: hypothetical protein P4L46_04650 [Fimbriimonas sp.]|nr:hypothetical protein [Fimbriimonas sp.]